MKKIITFLFVFLFFLQHALSQASSNKSNNRILLPNGWSLTKVGRDLPLGDLPLNMAMSPSNKIMAVTNNGQSVQSLQLIDVASETILDNILVPKLWYGLKFSGDGKFLFASGGNDNRILKYSIVQNHLILVDSIVLGNPWPEPISPAGIEINDKANLLFTVTKENNSLYIVDLVTKKILKQIALPDAAYSCLLSRNKKLLYISCWGCDKILVYDIKQQKITSEIKVGDNPNEILLSKNGRILFVSNANDNSVSVIDLSNNMVIETLNGALYPNAPSGSSSNGLALSKNGNTLFVANADNNCLAVFDVTNPGKSRSKGFIPTAWYPTNVKVVGNKILVTNGKGFSSKANPHGPNPTSKKQEIKYQKGDSTKIQEIEYIGGLFKGTLSIIDMPGETTLNTYSQWVYENTPYTKAKETNAVGIELNNPIPSNVGMVSPIKYHYQPTKINFDQKIG